MKPLISGYWNESFTKKYNQHQATKLLSFQAVVKSSAPSELERVSYSSKTSTTTCSAATLTSHYYKHGKFP